MNRNLTIALVVVFAVLLVYVLVVQLPKDRAAASVTGTPAVNYLWTSFTADKVTGVHVVDRVQKQEVNFVKDAGGAWSITAPTPQPADQSAAATYASGLTTLMVDATYTSVTDLSAYGVLSPTYTVEVTLSDGSKLTAAIGDKDPTGSDYYVLRGGEKTIEALASTSLTTLTGMITVPPVVAPTATTTPGPGTPSVTPPPPPGTAQTPIGTAVTASATAQTPIGTAAVTAIAQTPVGTAGLTATLTATAETPVGTPGATATVALTNAAGTATP